MKQITDQQRESFYAAALAGLHALESRERTSRRFGTDADARWQSFRGHLELADRIDLLVRDAAVRWQSGFSPALVFQLPYLADDEPFGPDWGGLTPAQAERLWRSAGTPADLSTCAAALGVADAPVSCPIPEPSTRLIVAGGSAILGVAKLFFGRPELSWSNQVLVVAEVPANRQLAGLVAPVIGAKTATRLTAPGDDVAAGLKAAGFATGGDVVALEDAAPQALAFARAARRGN